MAQAQEKSLMRRVHDSTCPGAFANFKPMQKVCPVCRADAANRAGG